MHDLWLVGQVGIALEFIGAALVVYYAATAKRRVERLAADMDALEGTILTIRDEVGSQFRKQVFGFFLFGTGLALQFIGNFANAPA